MAYAAATSKNGSYDDKKISGGVRILQQRYWSLSNWGTYDIQSTYYLTDNFLMSFFTLAHDSLTKIIWWINLFLGLQQIIPNIYHVTFIRYEINESLLSKINLENSYSFKSHESIISGYYGLMRAKIKFEAKIKM